MLMGYLYGRIKGDFKFIEEVFLNIFSSFLEWAFIHSFIQQLLIMY